MMDSYAPYCVLLRAEPSTITGFPGRLVYARLPGQYLRTCRRAVPPGPRAGSGHACPRSKGSTLRNARMRFTG